MSQAASPALLTPQSGECTDSPLDDLFHNLISGSNTDRSDRQRSPLPLSVAQKQRIVENCPKFFLPTSQVTRLMQECQISSGQGTAPRYSMPDLSSVDESEGGAGAEAFPGTSPGGRYYQDASKHHQIVHQRAVSCDTTYDPSQPAPGKLVKGDFKCRSAAEMGESDQMVEQYWEVATPPRSPTVTASPPPPYGQFLSPDDATHGRSAASYIKEKSGERPASPLAQKSYKSPIRDSNQR